MPFLLIEYLCSIHPRPLQINFFSKFFNCDIPTDFIRFIEAIFFESVIPFTVFTPVLKQYNISMLITSEAKPLPWNSGEILQPISADSASILDAQSPINLLFSF